MVLPVDRESRNFEIGKALAILIVVVGHFEVGPNIWMIVSVGLFIFGFSSGFFTSAKYNKALPLGPYWRNKCWRLVPDLLLCNLVLVLLLSARGRPGLWTWQSALHGFGLSGILNWSGLANPSPLGAGLWFFTVLLAFYLVYPLLRPASRLLRWFGLGTAATLVACLWLQRHVDPGHMLWVTAWSFVFGVFVERSGLRIRSLFCILGGLGAVVALLVLNVTLKFTAANMFLLILACISAALWLCVARLPSLLARVLRPVTRSMLPIYVMHSYLFVRPTQIAALDLALSLALIIAASWLLSALANLVRSRLRARRRDQGGTDDAHTRGPLPGCVDG